jgi:hypothetical protein
VYALVGQPLSEEHYNAVEMLVKLLKGEKIPYANELLAPLITKADLDKDHQLNDKVDCSSAHPDRGASAICKRSSVTRNPEGLSFRK